MAYTAVENNPPPWYRQFWPWALIALPATAVIASIATLIIAMQNPDGLVVDDYYKQGLAINQTLARDRHARFLGLQASGRIGSDGRVELALSGKQPVAADRLRLRLLHPTRANQDQMLWLTAAETAGHYRGQLETPQAGYWHLLLEPEKGGWRLVGRLHWPGEGQIALAPARGSGE